MERGRLKEMFSPEIEKIDRKTLRQMQLERLKHIVRYAYENVPMYRKRFDAIGLKPEHIRTLKDIEKYSLHDERRSAGKLSFRAFCGTDEKDHSSARVERHDGKTDCGRVYARGY